MFDAENITQKKVKKLVAKLHIIRENPAWYIENWNSILLEIPQVAPEERIVIDDTIDLIAS